MLAEWVPPTRAPLAPVIVRGVPVLGRAAWPRVARADGRLVVIEGLVGHLEVRGGDAGAAGGDRAQRSVGDASSEQGARSRVRRDAKITNTS